MNTNPRAESRVEAQGGASQGTTRRARSAASASVQASMSNASTPSIVVLPMQTVDALLGAGLAVQDWRGCMTVVQALL